MADQYVATDKRSGLEITVTGQFPTDPEDRVRIARTANLFTRLMSSILTTENTTERRMQFRALETQLELADALSRQDIVEAQRLMRETLLGMGVSEDQLRQASNELREKLEQMTGQPLDEEIARALGIFDAPPPDDNPDIEFPGPEDVPPDDRAPDDRPDGPPPPPGPDDKRP